VPVEVCPACGQVLLGMPVAKRLDELFDRLLASGAETSYRQILWMGGRRPSGGVSVGGAPFLEVAVDEDRAGANERDELGTVDSAPACLGGIQQLVGHRGSRVTAARPLGGALPQPHGRERRLHDIRGAQVLVMLGGEVEERQQHVEVVGDLGDRLGVGGEVGREPLCGVDRGGAGLAV
jgi:hypothetical protein